MRGGVGQVVVIGDMRIRLHMLDTHSETEERFMKERFRRIGAVILALCLLLTTLNLGVLAEDAAVEADAPDAAPLSGADDALDSAPQIEYSASGYSGAYDGAAHAITVNVATAGCSVRYAYPVGSAYGTNNPTFTVPGTYTVGYLITAPSYPDVEGSATVTITEGTIDYRVRRSAAFHPAGRCHRGDQRALRRR